MNRPVHQHFIPRSYLNNFGERDNDKCIIHGKRIDDTKIIPLSTRDICVNKNLYTIPTNDENRKFDIEHFYADKVDRKFPEVYKILADKNIQTIDFETRLKIVSTTLSLYFRTPKFLNIQNQLFERIVNEFSKNTIEETITLTFLNETLTINKKEAEHLIKEKKENNRVQFLFEHLQNYEKFVQSKLVDNMCVYHISDDSEFITCDNPVIIRPFADPTSESFNYETYYNQEINPFDSTNMIHLPIDGKTILTILPSTELQPYSYLQRLDIGLVDVLMYNSDIQKYSEKWILGSENGVTKHINDQLKYNQVNPENIKMMDDYMDKVVELKRLVELLEKHGSKNEIVLQKIKTMKSKPHICADINFQKLAKQIEE